MRPPARAGAAETKDHPPKRHQAAHLELLGLVATGRLGLL